MTLPSHATPWSTQQREWLQALGHDVLMLAPAGDIAAGAPERKLSRDAAPMAAAPDAPAKAVAAASPLLRALARAAGRNEQDPEFLATLPDLAALRGNPAARRALWPRLRGLRKRMP